MFIYQTTSGGKKSSTVLTRIPQFFLQIAYVYSVNKLYALNVFIWYFLSVSANARTNLWESNTCFSLRCWLKCRRKCFSIPITCWKYSFWSYFENKKVGSSVCLRVLSLIVAHESSQLTFTTPLLNKVSKVTQPDIMMNGEFAGLYYKADDTGLRCKFQGHRSDVAPL